MDNNMHELRDKIQKEAVSHIKDSFKNKVNPICALYMGLGKTRVTCKIIRDIMLETDGYRILIVLKTSNYKDPWIDDLLETECISQVEFKRKRVTITEYEKCIYMQGKDRKRNYNTNSEVYILPSKHIYIAPYDTLRIDIEANHYDLSVCFDLIVFDELQLIINTNKGTKNLSAISKLKANKKLALSGTPIQNTLLEIGLMYLFLNDEQNLRYYLSLSHKIREIENGENEGEQEEINDTEEKENRQDSIENINKEKTNLLLIGIDNCIKKNAIHIQNVEKSNFIKTAFILSLPIDPKHYELAHTFYPGKFWRYFQKRIMYLSSPSSVYLYNYKNEIQPYCTKEKAVEIILKRMGSGEKAIIFSRFKDVLYSYDSICKKLKLPNIILTGKDKGKSQDESLHLFKTSDTIRVLLTTLQKSSEGFNFNYANHIIILEFWWNPQKIMQAMSRIDRLTQENNNIYIYLLGYNGEIEYKNKKGESIFVNGFIKEEFVFLSTMTKKHMKQINSMMKYSKQIILVRFLQ